jgi:hypothetical protein
VAGESTGIEADKVDWVGCNEPVGGGIGRVEAGLM